MRPGNLPEKWTPPEPDPRPPGFAELARAARKEARAKLAETDWIAVKSAESGRALASEWKAWRSALRDIAGGDAPGPVPPEPAERWA